MLVLHLLTPNEVVGLSFQCEFHTPFLGRRTTLVKLPVTWVPRGED
jgi:hypothetical protein